MFIQGHFTVSVLWYCSMPPIVGSGGELQLHVKHFGHINREKCHTNAMIHSSTHPIPRFSRQRDCWNSVVQTRMPQRTQKTELHTEMCHGLIQKQIATLLHGVNTQAPSAPAVSLPDAFSCIVLKDNQGVKCNQAEIVLVWQVREAAAKHDGFLQRANVTPDNRPISWLQAVIAKSPIPDDWTCHCIFGHIWSALKWAFLFDGVAPPIYRRKKNSQ